MKHTFHPWKWAIQMSKSRRNESEVVERDEKKCRTATQLLCRYTVRGDRASRMHPQNASAAQYMPSKVPGIIGISHYMHLQFLYVVFRVSECLYPIILYVLSSLPYILGFSEQYITSTPLATVPVNIKMMLYPRIHLILLHPSLRSTPIYQYMPQHRVHCLSECQVFWMFQNSFLLLGMFTISFLQGSITF